MSYYNTLNESGEALRQSTVKAERQKDIIYRFFLQNPYGQYTPLMIHRLLDFQSPETSTRRAISDLTKEDKLTKTDMKFKEKYGSPNFMWKLKTQEGQTTLNF